MSRALYVETSIAVRSATAADDLWSTTQHPALHPLWDLRFSSITPAGLDADGRQEFAYALALPHPRLPLVTVSGTGTSAGERRSADGAGTSALTFVSHSAPLPSRRAPGTGATPPGAGTTAPPRSGSSPATPTAPDGAALGRLLDPWVVRPLVWWATAWSFDRLRLWVERGQHPARSRDLALGWTAAKVAVAAAAAAWSAATPSRGRWAGAVLALAALAAIPPPTVPSASRCRSRPARPAGQRAHPQPPPGGTR